MRRITLLAALALMTGCGRFWENPYVTVTETPLNWCEIHYYNTSRKPIRRVAVRITGAGFVEVRSGTSRRVSDSFAKTMTDPTWNDFHPRQFQIDPVHVRKEFQRLVDAGLFDRDKMFKSTKYPSPGRFIAVRAAIDNKTYSEPENIFESDPELADRLYNVVLEFNRPMFGSRRGNPIHSTPADKDEKKDDEKKSEENDK